MYKVTEDLGGAGKGILKTGYDLIEVGIIIDVNEVYNRVRKISKKKMEISLSNIDLYY